MNQLAKRLPTAVALLALNAPVGAASYQCNPRFGDVTHVSPGASYSTRGTIRLLNTPEPDSSIDQLIEANLLIAEVNCGYQITSKEDATKLEDVFAGHVENWRKETGGSSMMMRRYAHPAYQEILVLGGKNPRVVELILKELQSRPDMWFEALRRLTGQNPAIQSKTFDESVAAWLAWGRKEKLIS